MSTSITDLIQQSQEIETELIHDLEKALNENSLTSNQYQSMADMINLLSKDRIQFYKFLSENQTSVVNKIQSSNISLADQSVALLMVENQLNETKRRLQSIQRDKLKKLRLVEINEYYGQKYHDYTWVVIKTIIVLVIFTLLSVLVRKDLLSLNLYWLLILVVGIIGGIIIIQDLISIWNRDEMNYQEFNWAFDSASAPRLKSAADMAMSNNIDPWALSGDSVCVGQDCCSGNQIWNEKQNKCMPPTEGFFQREEGQQDVSKINLEEEEEEEYPPEKDKNMDFINRVFTKYSSMVQNLKPDVVLQTQPPTGIQEGLTSRKKRI